jgi:hypothetical protein
MALQVAFAATVTFERRTLSPLIPDVPVQRVTDAMTFGDAAFLHRILARQVQDFGDTGGRMTRMADYDASQIIAWLDMLDRLDSKSQYQIAMALAYFGFTPKPEALRSLVLFASRAIARSPANRIHWLREAIVIADRRLRDPALAIALADQLADSDQPGLKILAYQLSPLLRAKHGDYAGAVQAMRRALSKATPETPSGEIEFMNQFIREMSEKLGNTATWVRPDPIP